MGYTFGRGPGGRGREFDCRAPSTQDRRAFAHLLICVCAWAARPAPVPFVACGAPRGFGIGFSDVAEASAKPPVPGYVPRSACLFTCLFEHLDAAACRWLTGLVGEALVHDARRSHLARPYALVLRTPPSRPPSSAVSLALFRLPSPPSPASALIPALAHHTMHTAHRTYSPIAHAVHPLTHAPIHPLVKAPPAPWSCPQATHPLTRLPHSHLRIPWLPSSIPIHFDSHHLLDFTHFVLWYPVRPPHSSSSCMPGALVATSLSRFCHLLHFISTPSSCPTVSPNTTLMAEAEVQAQMLGRWTYGSHESTKLTDANRSSECRGSDEASNSESTGRGGEVKQSTNNGSGWKGQHDRGLPAGFLHGQRLTKTHGIWQQHGDRLPFRGPVHTSEAGVTRGHRAVRIAAARSTECSNSAQSGVTTEHMRRSHVVRLTCCSPSAT